MAIKVKVKNKHLIVLRVQFYEGQGQIDSNFSIKNICMYSICDPSGGIQLLSLFELLILSYAKFSLCSYLFLSQKDKMSYIKESSPDILCVQETKCQEDQLPPGVLDKDYHIYWSPAEKAGYAGTGLYSKKKPIKVTYGLGERLHVLIGALKEGNNLKYKHL